MKTKILAPILSLALAAAALPALAGHDDGRFRDRDRIRRSERVMVTAHKVEKQARRVHRLAERNAHHRTFLEEKALERLHRLEDEARNFHRSVESRRIPRRVLERDFQRLLRAFYRAENSLHWMHAYDVVEREFDRLTHLVETLEAEYGGRSYGWHTRRWRRLGSFSSPAWGPRFGARGRG